jgi:hypothetical protein
LTAAGEDYAILEAPGLWNRERKLKNLELKVQSVKKK